MDKKHAIAGQEYFNPQFEEFSFNKLLNTGNSDSTFIDQSVLILKQRSGPSIRNTETKSPVDPYDVIEIIQIDRNSQGQIYTAQDLNTSLHLAVSHAIAEEIVHRIRFFYGHDLSSVNIEPKHIRIRSNENHLNENGDGIFVLNNDSSESESTTSGKKSLRTIKNLFRSVCNKGLFDKMNFSGKKRANNDEHDAHGDAPVLHFGFTNSNCRANPANRTSTVGSVGPSVISSGFDNLSDDCLKALVKLISTAEDMCPEGKDTFHIPDTNTYRKKYRRRLNEAFKVNFDTEGNPTGSYFISCEGFTIIIPLVLSAHRDFLNDFIKG